MKTTAAKIKKDFPFLTDLLAKAKWSGQKKVDLVIHVDKNMDIGAPWHDACCRYTAGGRLNGKTFAHYAGCYDSGLCNQKEVFGVGINGKRVNPGCFFAVADGVEYYRVRDLRVYLCKVDSDHLLT